MGLTGEELREIEERLNNTQQYQDGGNNLVVGDDNGEFQFIEDGDSEFLVNASMDMYKLIREVKELRFKLKHVKVI